MSIFTVFLKNKNIIFKIRRSKVTDYAALIKVLAALYVKLLVLSCNGANMFVTNVDYNVCFIYRDLFGDELKSSDEPQTTESMETRYYILDFF